MINIAICDDEKTLKTYLRDILEIHLQLTGQSYKIDLFDTGELFLQFQNKYDIVFLDIEMGTLGGMETARELRKINADCIIIFVTAFADYVFQGYEVQALNYILKPFTKEKIKTVLDVALSSLSQNQDLFFFAEIKGETYKINLYDTLYFLSDKRKIIAVTKTKNYEFYGKLEDITATLPSFFSRTHQRYLVNLNFIDQIQNENCVVAGEIIPISRKYNNDVMLAFGKIMLQ